MATVTEKAEELIAFDPTTMKKKKKKKISFVADVADGGPVAKAETPEEPQAPEDANQELDEMSFGKKKKKKTVTVVAPGETAASPSGEASDATASIDGGAPRQVRSNSDWQTSDRDYDYFELLDRMQQMLLNEGKSSSTFKDSKLRLPPPDLVRDGTTKTVWANFPIVCKKLHRSLDHVLEYTLAELGTNGSIDGSQRLTIRGRFMPKQVESVVRHYVAEFVKCNTCGSTDTELKKENRMNFLHCNTCQSRRTVVSINKGYVAQVRRRKKN